MRGIALISAVIALAACAEKPDEPRDPKIPLPKSHVPAAVVQLEPYSPGAEQTRPLIMRAVLRCKLDAEGRTRCELEVPRARAPSV